VLTYREDFDSLLDMTKFKTKAGWGTDPMKSVETKVKSAFTRLFNKAGLPVRCTIMVEDAKKSKGRAAAPPPDDGEQAPGGELAEVLLPSDHLPCRRSSNPLLCYAEVVAPRHRYRGKLTR
jgi:hypothetical protein